MREPRRRARDDRRARRRDRRRAHGRRARAGSTLARASSARATSRRPSSQGAVGATTVGGTLAVCGAAGIGVHGDRRPRRRPPRLADATRRLRRPAARSRGRSVLVVSSGVKSLLDVPATAELLETLGVPVLGYRTDELPLFYAARGGPAVSGAGRIGRRGGADRRRALGARRRRPPARPTAGREPRRRRAADRAGTRGGRGRRACTARP